MEKIQQIVPISLLRSGQDKVFAMMDKAPVILAQHRKPRAVLVSVSDWDATVTQLESVKRRLARLEGYLEAKRNLEQMQADPSSTITLSELCEKLGVVEKPVNT